MKGGLGARGAGEEQHEKYAARILVDKGVKPLLEIPKGPFGAAKGPLGRGAGAKRPRI